MAGITDHAFRSFMKKNGASVVVTELVSASGIKHLSKKTFDLMSFDSSQRPLGIQLFGESPEEIAEAAKVVQDRGADFVDLNFGCPVPKVVKKGAGSAVLKDLVQLQKILSKTRKAVQIPVTIKIRTGWDQNSRNADEVCKVAADEGILWVAIHGRTRAQGYEGFSDWDYIRQVKLGAKIPVLGNGDIHTAEQALQRLKSSGCDGVLIGRGCLKNPMIFLQALRLLNPDFQDRPQTDIVKIYLDLFEFLKLHCEDRVLTLQLKKFAAWFATGHPGAALFRKTIFQKNQAAEILQSVSEFFGSIPETFRADTASENFLMGGHG